MTFERYNLSNNGKKFMERYRLESGKIIKGYIRWFHPIKVGDYLFRLHQAHRPEDKKFRDAITWALANGYRRIRYINYEINGKMFSKFVPSTERSMRRAQWERLHYYHGKI